MRIVFALVLGLLASTAHSALVNRGGGLIYDTTLDITWLQDASYIQTSGADDDGLIDWAGATAWVSSLSYYDSVRDVTYDDWRLPLTRQPDSSCGTQTEFSGYPTQGSGARCTGSEMGHLFNVDGVQHGASGLFTGVQGYYYWSQSSYAPDTRDAWSFSFASTGGVQTPVYKIAGEYAWAVRDGDVSNVPLPSTVWLLSSGLLTGLGWARSRHRARRI
jgi:hypothetical protein